MRKIHNYINDNISKLKRIIQYYFNNIIESDLQCHYAGGPISNKKFLD